jgi:hypothetical protein
MGNMYCSLQDSPADAGTDRCQSWGGLAVCKALLTGAVDNCVCYLPCV